MAIVGKTALLMAGDVDDCIGSGDLIGSERKDT
jgi:hypothetical protein